MKRKFTLLSFLLCLLFVLPAGVIAQLPVPPALNTVPVPEPPNLFDFITDKQKAVELGKALFWDMALGSDGDQACASCHFNAGADMRSKNALSPGLKSGDETFQLGGPNFQLEIAHFPLTQFTDPVNRFSPIIQDYNEVVSSAGVAFKNFKRIVEGDEFDRGRIVTDPIFSVIDRKGKMRNTRRVEPRNTPTVINAVFNLRNFWDGRANHNFNGVSPFGLHDPSAVIYQVGAAGVVEATPIMLPLSSLASQAVGPPLSDFEMSFANRIWPQVGKKMLALRPLSQQLVDPTDSVLGPLANTNLDPLAPGLQVSYITMIQQAFQPKFWADSTYIIRHINGVPTIVPWPTHRGKLNELSYRNEYSLIEQNFSLFFGLAVQLYEATLISDNSKFDQFARGETTLTPQEQRGLDIFMNIGLNPDPNLPAGFCGACHTGSEFTAATVSQLGRVEPPVPGEPLGAPEGLVERMPFALAAQVGTINMSTDPLPDQAFFPAGFSLGSLLGLIEVVPSAVMAPAGTATFSGSFPAGTSLGTPGLVAIFLNPEPVTAADPLVDAALTVNAAGEVGFSIATLNLPLGFYDVMVDGFLLGTIEIIQNIIYDVGFYNIGVRPTLDDLVLGAPGVLPDGRPLAFVRQLEAGIPTAEVVIGIPGGGFLPAPPFIPGERTVVDGAFKVPTLRNVELTAPYFHNGGQRTLHEVVEFYNRGADFHETNIQDLAPEIVALGMTPVDIDAVVAFLKTLTDERVRTESAPFDRPQIFISKGHKGDHLKVSYKRGVARDKFMKLAATGAAGGAPIAPFLSPGALAKGAEEYERDENGKFVFAKETIFSDLIPQKFNLHQNYPNPFNPTTNITYDLPKPGNVQLIVYDLLGKKVRTLVNTYQPAGSFKSQWDGRNDEGTRVGSGVYILSLKTEGFASSRKMILAK